MKLAALELLISLVFGYTWIVNSPSTENLYCSCSWVTFILGHPVLKFGKLLGRPKAPRLRRPLTAYTQHSYVTTSS